jgi:hypothetical protein
MTPIRVAGLAVKSLTNIGASARFRFAPRPKRLLLRDGEATNRAGFFSPAEANRALSEPFGD